MSVREQFNHILQLQHQYSRDRSPAMVEREDAIRSAASQIRAAIESVGPMGIADLAVESGTGIGICASVPWIRIASKSLAPSAMKGWYLVYLFGQLDAGVYLVLMPNAMVGIHGTATASALKAEAQWARNTLESAGHDIGELTSTVALKSSAALARKYQHASSVAIHYPAASVPEDSQIIADLQRMMPLLRCIYEALPNHDEAIAVEPVAKPADSIEPQDMAFAAGEFADAAEAAGVKSSELDRERALLTDVFFAALAAKPLVILTGLSGSGKSLLAKALGEWFGEGRALMLPVRPDWTGPESLFGFEDVLRGAGNGSRCWHVPEAMEFLTKAARDCDSPHLLVLDEMNLAHVERYFADVLSGMESRTPCLPSVSRGEHGWTLNDPARVPFPRNVFVVGTVNIDETTYMFSPKVLDRAFTFEFRVCADDLTEGPSRPSPVEPGKQATVNILRRAMADDGFQDRHPNRSHDSLGERLRDLHRLLGNTGFEFGHRTFFEAMRFAAFFDAVTDGDEDGYTSLDLIVKLKVLPRIHGSYRILSNVLQDIGWFCLDPESVNGGGRADRSGDVFENGRGVARLPLSFEKLQRMNRVLRANQFVSFAEC